MTEPLAAFPWSDTYALGHQAMDQTHREFVAILDSLARAGDAEFPLLLAQFATHTQLHFEQESVWMNDSGFPPVHCHEGEHERVLETVRVVGERVARGELALGRQLVAALAEWFPLHAGSMDTMLAGWLLQPAAERGTASTSEAACGGKTEDATV